ncbi:MULTISPECIES: alginate lyase family protein [unclassified Nocardia]|uniref:alginate lyase family protein n=1 Tax=unclassified Nocardia TaxID=2637762 RepID=UPI001CE4713A|nr:MULTISPECIES: alginate lyase family protein [unclassified Nocardia]
MNSSTARPVRALAMGVLALLGTTVFPPNAAALPDLPVPNTVVLDGQRLAAARTAVQAGDPAALTALANLTAMADKYVNQGPWTVVAKDYLPPSGDKHDYVSLAPYYWPTADKTADNPNGCPYENRDGQRNPDVDAIPDKPAHGKMFDAVYSLTLAWYYTGNIAYADRAILDLRTWFLDPATRMNPNLNFAQGVPCMFDGQGIGIIDFSQQFTDLMDATAILDAGAPGWNPLDRIGMTLWYRQFLDWLRTSPNGRAEAAADNNHGSFFDMQAAGLALAGGMPQLAADIVAAARNSRIDGQLAADGTQPRELTRTRSWHYSTFNLLALTRLAMIGRHVGVDLWDYRNPNGGSIFGSVDYTIPAATGTGKWPYDDLEFKPFAANEVIHAAADAGDTAAQAALPGLSEQPRGDMWILRPAPEQLDSINPW